LCEERALSTDVTDRLNSELAAAQEENYGLRQKILGLEQQIREAERLADAVTHEQKENATLRTQLQSCADEKSEAVQKLNEALTRASDENYELR
jgi:hypothetical protein